MVEVVKRARTDRRAGLERRQCYDVGYFEHGGTERRTQPDRRVTAERRHGWTRISQWESVRIRDVFEDS